MHAPHLYVDSAETGLIDPLLEAGLVTGVTTNPTILERGGARVSEIPALYERWVGQGAREVFAGDQRTGSGRGRLAGIDIIEGRIDRRGTGRQRMHDGRGREQHVDDHHHPALQP